MKRLLLYFPCLFLTIPMFSQLNIDHNHIRIGDQIIKQQVEYKEPGKSGKNIVWDFQSLKSVNDEYALTYSSAPLLDDSLYIMGYNQFDKKTVKIENLIVGTEHNTMYYYQQKGDTLLLLGHENPAVKLQYIQPYIQMTYPFNYGQTTKSTYLTRGLYSGIDSIHTKGTVETTADAYGKIILPTGDTINPVLRIKTIQTIIDPTLDQSEKQVETYRWYTKGYRYPIFETIRNINMADNTILFATSFHYPPQEHYYLDTDPENQKLLDEMWDMDNANVETQKRKEEQQDKHTANIEDLISYQIYPNPVKTDMKINYTLKDDNPVTFQLFNFDGTLIKQIKKEQQTKGDYSETMNCSNLMQGNYVLRITINNVFVNVKIIKL